MSFPDVRLRRLRQSPAVRGLVRETSLEPRQLVLPLFVREGLTAVSYTHLTLPTIYSV